MTTDRNRTILLSRSDIATLMTPADYLVAVESAFRLARAGKARSPAPLHIPATAGGFHAKGAALDDPRRLVAVKLNGNFPGNPAHGLPTIQGVITLCDGERGRVLAIMDSIEITMRRTAAASALAARHLARRDAASLLVCGCGDQARAHAPALAQVLALRRGWAWDADPDRAAAYAAETGRSLAIPFEPATDLRAASRSADVIVTCSTARAAFLDRQAIAPGVFIAAVGADNPDKSEIAPDLMAAATVVVDDLRQCLEMGDLRHAVAAGTMSAADVHAELGDIVAGSRPGRTGDDQVIVFDSTGTAIQDVASAGLAYGRAVAHGVGLAFALA